jgi:hypothetical protein
LAPEVEGSTDQEKCDLEPLLSNWKVFIDKNGDETWQEGEDFRITSASGPNMGEYVFEQLPAGQTYKICEVPQAGWTQTYPTEKGACHSGQCRVTALVISVNLISEIIRDQRSLSPKPTTLQVRKKSVIQ